MSPALEDCVAGRISPHIALAHLLFEGKTAQAIAAEIAASPPHPLLEAVQRLLAGREAQLDAIAKHTSETIVDHHAHGATPAAGVAQIAGYFDRAVQASPEASVALHSLGDPALLQQATDEIVDWLAGRGLIAPERDVVDLGCGIGRVALTLAPRTRSVVGLDVSAGMIAEARRRAAGVAHVRFEQSNGQDLAAIGDAGADLILAVDSFPYILQTGTAAIDRHFAEFRRTLRPGGAAVLLNISYEIGHDDGALARAYAARYGWALEAAAAYPFAIWDGSASVFRPA